jgi:methionyl-tRNA formyltransferase
MRIAIIGRTEILYNTVLQLRDAGHDIVCILTAKEAPEYRRSAEDFRGLAIQLGVPFICSAKILEQQDLLMSVHADISVSINYSSIVPQKIIDIFPLGILNVHGGDLPRYRGNACQAWAILNGESRIGLCVHRMIGGELDSGDIIARDHLEIDHATKVTKVWEWLYKRIPELCLEAVNKLSIDPNYIIEAQSKNQEDAHRCYPRKPEDGRIDWRQSALNILRLINASNKPYAGAFCDFEGSPLIIWDAELVGEYENFSAVPGQVTKIGEGFIEVACVKSKIRILCAEYAGRVDLPTYWIKSIRKRLG